MRFRAGLGGSPKGELRERTVGRATHSWPVRHGGCALSLLG